MTVSPATAALPKQINAKCVAVCQAGQLVDPFRAWPTLEELLEEDEEEEGDGEEGEPAPLN